jgi:hypothetical protein
MDIEATVADGDGVTQKPPPAISQGSWRAGMIVGQTMPEKSARATDVASASCRPRSFQRLANFGPGDTVGYQGANADFFFVRSRDRSE